MKKQNILIAIPSRDTWKAAFGVSLCRLMPYTMLQTNHDITVSNAKGLTVGTARNMLARQALENNFDYILFLDDDMTFPHDALITLLNHNKEIVGVNYPRKHMDLTPTGKQLDGRLLEPKEGLEEVKYLGGGLLLINVKEVLSKLQYPFFHEDHENRVGEDAYFCQIAREAGISIWCDHDLSKKVGHLGEIEFKFKS